MRTAEKYIATCIFLAITEMELQIYVTVLNNELKPIFRIINPNYRFRVARAFPREGRFPCLFLGSGDCHGTGVISKILRALWLT